MTEGQRALTGVVYGKDDWFYKIPNDVITALFPLLKPLVVVGFAVLRLGVASYGGNYICNIIYIGRFSCMPKTYL